MHGKQKRAFCENNTSDVVAGMAKQEYVVVTRWRQVSSDFWLMYEGYLLARKRSWPLGNLVREHQELLGVEEPLLMSDLRYEGLAQSGAFLSFFESLGDKHREIARLHAGIITHEQTEATTTITIGGFRPLSA